MNQNNRFAPPTAQVSDLEQSQNLNLLSWFALAAGAAQLLASGLYSPLFFQLVNAGAFNFIHFFLYVVGTILLAVGGVLLFRKSSSATVWLRVSALFGLLSLLQSKPVISITGAVVAVLAAAASSRQFKARSALIRREGHL